MTDLRNRLKSLDGLRAPDLWSEVEQRAIPVEPSRRTSLVLIAVVLLVALAIGGAVLVGSGIVKLPVSVEASASPSADESAPPTSSPVLPTVPAWTATGPMIAARQFHTMTLLPDGKVLVAGGDGGNRFLGLNTAELYDPSAGSWALTGIMQQGRYWHTATLLANGQVLVVGGTGGSSNGGLLASAELYDPLSASWTTVASLADARAQHTATLLLDGTLLVTGGERGASDDRVESTELFDPVRGSWTTTGTIQEARLHHTATLLGNGMVLVAGGVDGAMNPLASAELYDPQTRTWTATGAMHQPRAGHTATRLPDGRVLVAGSGTDLDSAEVYDPGTGQWTAVESMPEGSIGHTAVAVHFGLVLVAGGGVGSSAGATAELFDPDTERWIPTATMLEGRINHTAVLLVDGTVLVAGGVDSVIDPVILRSAELYGPKVVSEPLPTAAPVFADQGPVTCTNAQDGYSVEVPAGWWYLITNDSCGYLDPEPFTFDDGATPQGPVAIRISVVQGAVGSFYEVVSSEDIMIAGHRTTRWELRAGGEPDGPPAGTLIYEYIVQLDSTPDDGPTLLAHTESLGQPNYEQNKLVLDAIMATLTTP
jgi:hypothetical protein